MNMKTFNLSRSAGFTLLEVMVSLLVFSAGMLGIVGLMVVSIKSNSSSYIKQQATQAAYDYVDRARSNTVSAQAGAYNLNNLTNATPILPSTPTTDCSLTTCTAAQIATYDQWYWLTKEVGALPNGCASVTTAVVGNNTQLVVTVQYDDRAAQGELGGATSVSVPSYANLSQVIVQTLL
jgi:type IV pilus assembly protein PilV